MFKKGRERKESGESECKGAYNFVDFFLETPLCISFVRLRLNWELFLCHHFHPTYHFVSVVLVSSGVSGILYTVIFDK